MSRIATELRLPGINYESAKVIKYRFEKPIIDKLLELQWWNYSDEKLRDNIQYFQTENVTLEKLSELERLLK